MFALKVLFVLKALTFSLTGIIIHLHCIGDMVNRAYSGHHSDSHVLVAQKSFNLEMVHQDRDELGALGKTKVHPAVRFLLRIVAGLTELTAHQKYARP